MNTGASVYNPVAKTADNYISVKTQRVIQLTTSANMANELKLTVRW